MKALITGEVIINRLRKENDDMKRTPYKHPLLRVATFKIDDILEHVFTRRTKKDLHDLGVKHHDKEWREACVRKYDVIIDGKVVSIPVTMESHRYQLFLEKGTVCKKCGLKGTFFALEKHRSEGEVDTKKSTWSTSDKYHFNLYGIAKNGDQVMLTKDHIIPRSKGGKNNLNNYQTLCIKCNSKKSDSV